MEVRTYDGSFRTQKYVKNRRVRVYVSKLRTRVYYAPTVSDRRCLPKAGPRRRNARYARQDVAGGIDVADNKREELTEPTSTQVEESCKGQRRAATE